jgi:hypothetical protein
VHEATMEVLVGLSMLSTGRLNELPEYQLVSTPM